MRDDKERTVSFDLAYRAFARARPYRRYVGSSGSDDREPLGTQYSVRHLLGGSFDARTRLLVWRDTGSAAAEPIACDARFPGWAAPFGLESYRVFLDEEGAGEYFFDDCSILPPCADYPLTRATQKVSYFHDEPEPTFDLARPSAFPFGKSYVVLRRAMLQNPPEQWEVLQGWVSVTHSAEDRYSVGQRAFRLDSACDPAPVAPAPSDF